jgi:hypothetical protein
VTMAAWQPRFPCLTSVAGYQRRHAHPPSPLERAQSHADQMRYAPYTYYTHGPCSRSRSFIQRLDSAAPPGYTTPEFPSLYWPLPPGAAQSYYLYNPGDILRFTIYWTLLLVGGIHLIVGLWACIVQWRNWKLIWITPPLFAAVGCIEGLIAGAIVGGL